MRLAAGSVVDMVYTESNHLLPTDNGYTRISSDAEAEMI